MSATEHQGGSSLASAVSATTHTRGSKVERVAVSVPPARDAYDATGVFSKALGSAKSGG